MSDVTRLLEAVEHGGPRAAEQLLPLVYDDLRKLAAHKMALEAPGQTLQATALVHEAWLRLAGSTRQEWRGREHFFSAAAEAMRRILVENARRKLRLRHGGGLQRVDIEAFDLPIAEDDEKCLRVHEALDQLAEADPRKAEVVKLRVFAGLGIAEVGWPKYGRRSRTNGWKQIRDTVWLCGAVTQRCRFIARIARVSMKG